MASQSFSVNFFLVALIAALFFAVTSAEELSAAAPAPGPDAGAAGSVSSSLAMIGASIVVSMLAILKQ
ncbi:hypothetical protein DEO72_LG6g345 [Vigna unguiculata]|uniref:Arabinogalactan peptide n=1 Tax=Vigna unguiculata TaxID=3917 RepID=A0A4D6M4H3_VIGUN|nr:hypothetical protein DEO72_LG6g345 [Vigna unguiculata]